MDAIQHWWPRVAAAALRDRQQQTVLGERASSRAPARPVIEAGATGANVPQRCGYYPGMNHDRDAAMPRSEEELAVDTVWRPAERVRVRRRVVEEEVMVAVTVRREELEIEREPASRFDPPRRDAGEPAETLVMVLHEERPVVGVEVVPTEVVRVHREVVHDDERTVSDTVRREQIEVEGA